MRGKRFSIAAAGIAGVLAVGAAAAPTAGAASAAAPSWHFVKKVKTDFSGQFSAVIATGTTTGWAFDGDGLTSAPTAWVRKGNTWTKMTAFPGKKNEEVVTAGASSPSNVWAFLNTMNAGSRALRWNGAKWTVARTFPAEIMDASVLAPNDVWVFGLQGFAHVTTALGVWHYNGRSWLQVSKTYQGGDALSANDVWAFNGTNIEHWNGHSWATTSVKKLLPPVIPGPLNDPVVEDILALSDQNVFAIGNGNDEDEGGPLVVLHYNGHTWAKVAGGLSGYGPGPEISSDGSGGLWLPITPNAGGLSYLAHYSKGKLTKAALPVSASDITIVAVYRIPGTTQQLAGGYTHANLSPGSNVVAVLLQYS